MAAVEEPSLPACPPACCRYSGTSADLLKTMFELIVSVKLFLGRFDQRTMQVRKAVAVCPRHML